MKQAALVAMVAGQATHESHLSPLAPEKKVRMVDDALLFAQAGLVLESNVN